MNQKIAVGEAISAGFRLIGREPLAFAVWCGAYFLMGAIPMAFSWGETQAVYSALAAGDADAAAQQAWSPLDIISIIVSLVFTLALPAAVMRAVLFPNERQFFYLRLGPRELWFLLTLIILVIMALLAYFATVLLLAVVGVAAAAGGAIAIVIVSVLSFVAGLAGACWLAVKFSMSGS